jgi:photosystem II stability/assembly factor-like uncharacterized protein
MISRLILVMMVLLLGIQPLDAQKRKNSKEAEVSALGKQNLSAFKFRNIGPAFTSGRIGDVAIHPDNRNVWYVAVASGGVWKTENSGTTWNPIFDSQSVYSIGCVTIDPNNPNRVWVGTGENVGGRHIGFGDGVYLSEDGGSSWKNMGLPNSEHISKVVVHPENSDVVMVAAQGPLWSKGGDRGFYLTEDGGKTWTKTLGDDEWVGVTDIVVDPRDANVVYAATWQRHRTVAAYLGGGEGSGVHKSTDGGKTWTELTRGLPGGIKGKIGLAISPQNPDYVYAAIELIRREGAVYLTTNKGASWSKMSNTVSGATGPHYYQELYASPHDFGTIYLVDVRMQVSYDHGKTFTELNTNATHSDSHSLNFVNGDPDYLLLGTDGGLYETVDGTKSWRYIKNLPVTQYYKVAVDDAEPFYNVFGGTQDNGSHGGPSRTDDANGIRNAHWSRVLGGDGHQSMVEPGNPNIGYAESQQGYLNRLDRITGEAVYIQPQPGVGEGEERFNWDSPILPSQHVPSTIYFASHRVWKSTDRGDSWETISGDLTRGKDRITEPIMGRTQSWDHAWDLYAMSEFSSITSFGESPINAKVLYAGTDDGLLHATTDGGANWTKTEVGSIKGVPAAAFVNDVRADLFDEATVYAVLDNHKEGDFRPFLVKSTDYGKSWSLMNGNLPEKGMLWRIVQDHEAKNLMFLAHEFGIYVTFDGGKEWVKMTGGLPTISFRDITIQRRENDLVGASFGRGFFILDDISPLRDFSNEMLEKDAHLFAPRDGYWYVPKNAVRYMGDDYWSAPNPDFGVTFTYFMKEAMSTMKKDRQKKEKAMGKDADIPFPGFDALDAEMREKNPEVHLEIYDAAGNMVQRVMARNASGIHRVSWNLSTADQGLINPDRLRGWSRGAMATPGTYKAQLITLKDGVRTEVADAVSFDVKPLREGALPGKSIDEMMSFKEELQKFVNHTMMATNELEKATKQVKAMQVSLSRSMKPDATLMKDLHDAEMQLGELDKMINGNLPQQELRDVMPKTVMDRISVAYSGLRGTYGPTAMHKDMLRVGKEEFDMIHKKMHPLMHETIPALVKRLKENGAPPVEGLGH